MKGIVFEIASLLLIVVCIAFFYRTILFLTEKDYLAAVMTLLAGFGVGKISVELARLSFYKKRNP